MVGAVFLGTRPYFDLVDEAIVIIFVESADI